MLNMNFEHRVVIGTQQQEWQESPKVGVWRKKLAREEDENGHATSIVRFDPGSGFSSHNHPYGEEILVLDGVFSDENGHYPIGTYLRHPAGYVHKPYSEKGCVILVKLHQFKDGDSKQVNIDTSKSQWYKGHGNLEVMPLHEFQGESTALVFWPAGEQFVPHAHFGGEEIFVISGEFIDEHGHYPKGSWIRSPHMSKHDPFVEEDTLILVKVGHLL